MITTKTVPEHMQKEIRKQFKHFDTKSKSTKPKRQQFRKSTDQINAVA